MADDFDIEHFNRETSILDRGYDAVRRMAKEMVENGAQLSDLLFHANQVWHEFKVAAYQAGLAEVAKTGMYIAEYNAEVTSKSIRADKRYARGVDAVRVAQCSARLKAQAARAGK
jgi:hypothetical protein